MCSVKPTSDYVDIWSRFGGGGKSRRVCAQGSLRLASWNRLLARFEFVGFHLSKTLGSVAVRKPPSRRKKGLCVLFLCVKIVKY